jgi:hypothetical protein
MRSICCLLLASVLASAMSLLKVKASLAQELSAEDRACILSSVAKLPNIPGLKVEGSRVLPQPQARRRNPDLYNVIVEIDVSIVGESASYRFNCIRNGQLTLIQPLGRSPGSMAQGLSVEDQGCITSAVEKVPKNPAIKIERSHVLPQSRVAQGRLYKVTVEIDVSLVGQVQLMGTSKNRSYSSDATKLSANDSASFPFRFMDVHARAARDPHREAIFRGALMSLTASAMVS